MKTARNAKPARNGFHIIPVLLLATGFLTGCGSEFSTNPLAITQPADEEVGELVLPTPGNGISAPKDLAVEYSAGTTSLTWTAPPQAYEAIVLRDGTEVGRVSAVGGEFSDTLPPREPGVFEFAYTVCFGRGNQVGPESTVVLYLPRRDFSDPASGADLAD